MTEHDKDVNDVCMIMMATLTPPIAEAMSG